MTEQQEKEAYEIIKKAEAFVNYLREELADKEETLMENIDAIIYVAMKLKDELNFIDTWHIKEIIEFYEG